MSDRHEKWVPVEPGTVIPAGQPFRTVVTHSANSDYKVPSAFPGHAYEVDSSWKPPLELPDTPTWGIAVHADPVVRNVVGLCHVDAGEDLWHPGGTWRAKNVADFIPLTPEQVARIEAAHE